MRLVVDADRAVDMRFPEVGESPPPPGLLVEVEHGPSSCCKTKPILQGAYENHAILTRSICERKVPTTDLEAVHRT